jgi:small subunit ribosomal protein S11
MNRLVKSVMGGAAAGRSATSNLAEDVTGTLPIEEAEDSHEPYHFHIYSHKHNTHITLTKPNRDAILSLSCGNIGFKKSGRKHYDSAYQLGAYFIDKMHQKGLVKKINKLEVVLRGFGAGREAVVKVLMGNEGKLLRGKIVRVSDSTRLKFGGTRSKRKRRLG